MYEFYNCPIFFENNWDPTDDNDSSSDSDLPIVVDEEEKTHEGDHLIFLLHGYEGTHKDMKNIRNTILKRYHNSRIYSCKSIQDVNSQDCK